MTRAESAARARAAKAAKQPPLETRFWSKVDRRGPNDCWPWMASPRQKDEGYGAFWLDGKHVPATRVAWALTHGAPNPKLKVCHSCDNPECCNPKHLFLGTSQQNADDKVAKGRQSRGETNNAKLTEAQVRKIKALKPPGSPPVPAGFRKSVAAQFNVSPATITDVWSRSWKHI